MGGGKSEVGGHDEQMDATWVIRLAGVGSHHGWPVIVLSLSTFCLTRSSHMDFVWKS